jgi:hypothetical protein
VNKGGAVLKSPVIYSLYWGDYWNTAEGKSDAAYNDGFAQEFGESSSAAVLGQYGAGPASFGAATTLAGAPPKRVFPNTCEQAIEAALQSGSVPSDAQGMYTLVLPPGVVFDAGEKSPDTGKEQDSLHDTGGFHFSMKRPNGDIIHYAIITYGQKGNGLQFSPNSRDNITMVESHEWAETETDPDVEGPGGSMAWYDDNYGEIADVAREVARDQKLPLSSILARDQAGYAQQLLWSNQDGRFEIAPPPPETAESH